MIRLGLCCIFRAEPIRFRQTTAKALLRTSRAAQLKKLAHICRNNLSNLLQALQWCSSHKIGAFRVLSPLFPRMTHPEVGYQLEELPGYQELADLCRLIRSYRTMHDLRLSLHPDQFNVLSSPHRSVVDNTLRELEYQGLLAELIGAEVINIHAGGVYGDKAGALRRLQKHVGLLSSRVRSRLSLENDDRCFTPADLLPVCRQLELPLTYDIHHHRCLGDSMSPEAATGEALATWQTLGREPYVHISSPRHGYASNRPQPHADYLDPEDFPKFWEQYDLSVDVEAKAKELAVIRLQHDLGLAAHRRQHPVQETPP